MTALALKKDVLKQNWVNNFSVIVHLPNDHWYHCHNDEELESNGHISLCGRLPLPLLPFTK